MPGRHRAPLVSPAAQASRARRAGGSPGTATMSHRGGQDRHDVTWVWLFQCELRRWSCGEFKCVLGCGRVAELAEVVAVVLAGDVPVPVGVEVAAGGDGAHPEHGLGAGQAPAGSGDAEAVADDVPAGALDDAGGDGPALGERRGVAEVRFLGLQVVNGLADVLVMLAAGPGGIRGGLAAMPAATWRLLPARMSRPQAVTWSSVARVSPGGVKQRAAFHRYSMTWMKSMRMVMSLPRFAASAWKQLIWWALPSTRASQSRSRAGSRRSASPKTRAMTSAQPAVMPQVYHLFTARGVRGGVPGWRPMTSRGVRGSPSGGRESKTAPVSAIRFFACFSPLPSRFSPFPVPFRGLAGRVLAQRVRPHRDALGVRGHPQHGEPFLPGRAGDDGRVRHRPFPAANASASAAARARISSSCRFPMLAPVAASTRSCPCWNDPARHAISASCCSRQEYPAQQQVQHRVPHIVAVAAPSPARAAVAAGGAAGRRGEKGGRGGGGCARSRPPGRPCARRPAAHSRRPHPRGVHALSRGSGLGRGGQRVAGAGWRRRRRVGSPVMVRPRSRASAGVR